MPEVPQNTGDILPAARERAARVVAHLTALGQDLRIVSDRRGSAEYAEGFTLLASAIESLQGLILSRESTSPSDDKSRLPEPGEQ